MGNWERKYPLCVCKEKERPFREIKYFADFLRKKGIIKGKILDLGCGYGIESLYLANLGFDVTGIDINNEAIKYARKKAHNKKNIKFICGDALKFEKKLKPNSFDMVIDSAFSHTLRKKERVKNIRDIYKILKKNGWLFFFNFSNEDEYCKKYCPKRRWTFRKGIRLYCHFFTKEEIRKLLKNFNIIKWKIVKGKPSKDLLKVINSRNLFVLYVSKE